MQCFIRVNVNFKKKKSDSCTSQKYDNVTTPYYPLFAPLFGLICQLVAYGRLKTVENFKLLAIKVVAVAYERWSLTLTSKLLENWSLRRGGGRVLCALLAPGSNIAYSFLMLTAEKLVFDWIAGSCRAYLDYLKDL